MYKVIYFSIKCKDGKAFQILGTARLFMKICYPSKAMRFFLWNGKVYGLVESSEAFCDLQNHLTVQHHTDLEQFLAMNEPRWYEILGQYSSHLATFGNNEVR